MKFFRKYKKKVKQAYFGLLVFLMLFANFPVVEAAEWHHPGYQNRQKITIGSGIADSDLTDFPILIAVTSTNDIFTDAQVDGDDLFFTKDDGFTELEYEIERFSKDDDQLFAWVQIPTLSSSANTDIFMYYGDSTTSTNATTTGVWDSYEMVYHFAENTGGSETNTFQDGVASYTGTTDVTIKSVTATTNYNSDTVTKVDGVACDSGVCRALMKWDVSSITSSCTTVDSASVSINATNSTADRYSVYALKRDWGETTATWNKFDGTTDWGTAGAADSTNDRFNTDLMNGNADGGWGSGTTGAKTHDFDSDGVAWLQDIMDGNITNYGIVIYDETADDDSYQWSTRADATVANRPKLTVVCDVVAGTTYLDQTANNHDVSAAGKQAIVASSTGPVWANTELDGSNNDFIKIPDSAGFDSTTWTIEAIFKNQGSGTLLGCGAGCTAIYPLITKGTGESEASATDVQFHLGLDASDFATTNYEDTASAGVTDSDNTTVSDNVWYYTAAVRNDSGNSLEAFLNDTSNGETTTSVSPNTGNTVEVCIGSACKSDSTVAGAWDGFIDEIRISNVARSNDWVESSYRTIFGGGTYFTYAAEETATTSIDQIHYRWRNDDGSESAASFGANEDTATTSVGIGKVIRLRTEVSNEGIASSSEQYILQYGTGSDPTSGTWTTMPASGSCGSAPFCIAASSLTEAAATTNVASGLTDENTTFVAGEQKETNATTTHISLSQTNFTEIEHAFQITNQAAVNTAYYFRLATTTGDGVANQLDNYSKTPQLTTATTIAQDMDQIHYRWRLDDDNEADASFSVAEDTATTSVGLSTTVRLRMEISNESIASTSLQYALQFGTNSSPTGSDAWTTVPASGSCGSLAFCMAASSLTEAAATTDVASGLTNEATTFVAGLQKEDNATTTHISIDSDNFTELEYALQATTNASNYTTYYFRVATTTGDGVFSQLDTFSQTPQLRTIVGTPTSLSATANGTTQIDLTWDSMTGATGYDIYQSTDDSTYTLLGTSPTVSSGATVSYSDTALSASTKYYHKIIAIEGGGRSDLSSSVNATTDTPAAAPAASSGGGGGSGASFSSAPPAPPAPSPDNPDGGFGIIINNSTETTKVRNVTLQFLTGAGIKKVALSRFSDLRDSGQIPFQQTMSYDLCSRASGLVSDPQCPEGRHTVYAKFYNIAGHGSQTISASINFSTKIDDVLAQVPSEKPQPQPSVKSTPQPQPTQKKISQKPPSLNIVKPSPATQAPKTPKSIEVQKPKPEPQKPPLTETIKDLIPFISDEPEIEELPPVIVPNEAPLALKGEWRLLANKKIASFVLAPIPPSINVFADKFPQISDTFDKLKIQNITDVGKLKVADLSLPGLRDVVKVQLGPERFSLLKGVRVQDIPKDVKKELPTDIVFVQSPDGKIDHVISLTLNDNNEPIQSVSTISGHPFSLTIIPEHPVQSIRGQIILTEGKYTDGTQYPGLLRRFFSSVFLPKQLSAKTVETRLVLEEFEYTDNDNDGVYTADISAPVVAGEYEIITIMDFENPDIVDREIRLVTVVDPEGYVFEKIRGQELRIQEATVSLFWKNDSGEFVIWPAQDYRQHNPQTTDHTGAYSFLVPEGRYYLAVETKDYKSYESSEFDVQQGRGVHINIEMKRRFAFLRGMSWTSMVLIVIVLLLGYNFYRDKRREKK